MLKRIPCSACKDVHGPQKRFCRECRGVGYIEHRVKVEGCTGQYPQCPIEREYAVGGWMCNKCGDSGPL